MPLSGRNRRRRPCRESEDFRAREALANQNTPRELYRSRPSVARTGASVGRFAPALKPHSPLALRVAVNWNFLERRAGGGTPYRSGSKHCPERSEAADEGAARGHLCPKGLPEGKAITAAQLQLLAIPVQAVVGTDLTQRSALKADRSNARRPIARRLVLGPLVYASRCPLLRCQRRFSSESVDHPARPYGRDRLPLHTLWHSPILPL